MANKKINQLVSKTAILSTDIFGIGDATTGQLFKKTIAELQAAIGGAVISVNGLVGTVVLDTDDIQELATPTNKYFTDARARGAISLTVTGNSGASTYSSGTGVLNVPTYTLAGLGGITATFLSGTSGISYNSSTGVISYSGTVYTDASIRALFSGGTGITYNSSTGAISYSGTVYTDSSVRALISMTTTGDSGASTYNNTTGVINVPNYTLAGLGGISYTSLSGGTGITYNNTTGAISYSGTVYTDASVRALISASGAVSYNNTTGVISLTSGNLTEATSSVLTITGGTGAVLGSGTSIQVKQASSTVSGFLSSTDWSTFNGKASALSGTTGYHAKFTSSTAIGNSVIYDDGTNVGINTTAPNYLLHINSSTTSNRIQLTNTSTGTAGADGLQIGQSGINAYITNREAGSFDIETSGIARISISSAGSTSLTGGTIADPVLIVTGNTSATISGNAKRLIQFRYNTGDATGVDLGYDATAGNGVIAGGTSANGAGIDFWTFNGSAWGNRMTLTKAGNITTPGLISAKMGSSGMAFETTNAVNADYVIETTSGGLTKAGTTGNLLAINSGSGNVLIGTTSNNGEKLYISGNVRATGTITANSDIRIKSNITKIENALEKVGQISGYTYNTNYDDKRHGGVIAQEIDKVFPEIVNTGNDGLMGVEYGNISALLIEAIKEQNTKIKNLETLLASK
jgi:hypothetical protein